MDFINVSTYPPRECGLASFSMDLRDSLVQAGHKVWVAAISDKAYQYSDEVFCEIQQHRRKDYVVAAKKINNSPRIKKVIIQHEYGIFGGNDGGYVVDFVAHLKKPFLLVTHTVLPDPTLGQRIVLQNLARQAAAVVSMSHRSTRLLDEVYGISPERVRVIPHGVPAFKPKSRELLKAQYGFIGRDLITTFGLIGPSKGLEIGIQTMEKLVDRHPDLLYLIAGKTHPVLLKRDGEGYRENLMKICAERGLKKHVKFINRFLGVEELGDLLYMTDIYLSPYPNRDQAVSGTLAYAVGCGRAIVSTPYEYALDLLKGQRLGLVASEASPRALSVLLNRLLSRGELKADLEKRAAAYGKTISWPGIAVRYADLAREKSRPQISKTVPQERALGGSLLAQVEERGSWR